MNASAQNALSPQTAKVLFVGLGTMGLPMASNLVRAGFSVTGLDANPAAVDAFCKVGGHKAPAAAEAAKKASVVVTMLPDDAIVTQVIGGKTGLIAALPAGALVIEMSTTAPATKIALAKHARDRGVDFIECPVGRTMENAIAGTLSLMAAGDTALIERAQPLLMKMGSELHLCGEIGAGSAIKLINNALVASVNAASIEALVAARKAGIEIETLFKVLKTTMAWNNALANGLPKKALRRDFKPGFMTKLQHKDVGLALRMANELGAPMKLGKAAYDVLQKAVDTGFASDDGSGSMLRVYEAESGVVVKLDPPPARNS